MNELRYITGVATLQLKQDECIGCGLCETVCPHQVFQLEDKKASIRDLDGCIECGACASNCPVKAISVTPGVGCASYIILKWIKGKDAVVDCC
jgi:ferredoxin